MRPVSEVGRYEPLFWLHPILITLLICRIFEPDCSGTSDSDEYDPYSDLVSSSTRDNLLALAMREAFKSRRPERDAMRELAMQEAFEEQQALQKERDDVLAKQREWQRQTLVPVLAEIISRGHSKKLCETSEIGPAPHGFQYIQLE
jgi:hypothetical protein